MVVAAIAREAEAVLDLLRTASNPGKVWEKWKSSIRSQLQAVQKKLRQQDTQAIDEARVQLDLAAERYRSVSNDSSREHFDDALRNY